MVNAAAYTKVDLAESEAEAARRGNADRPGDARRGLRGGGIPLIHISTDYVFDGSEAAAPIWRTIRSRRSNVYGRSKAAGERAVRETHAAPRDPAHLLGLSASSATIS